MPSVYKGRKAAIPADDHPPIPIACSMPGKVNGLRRYPSAPLSSTFAMTSAGGIAVNKMTRMCRVY